MVQALAGAQPPTVEFFCNRIHKALIKQFKYAVIVYVYVYVYVY
jgi:ribosome-interacting GTPase 1